MIKNPQQPSLRVSRHLSRRTLLTSSTVAGAAALASTGCWGGFNLTGVLYNFNDGVSSSKWVKWLVFLVLIIIPVYGITIFLDAIIFNTIEFYTGSNPVNKSELGDGRSVVARRTNDPLVTRLEHYEDGELQRVMYTDRSDSELRLLDQDRQLVLRVRQSGDVVQLLDADGSVLMELDGAERRALHEQLKQGKTPSHAATVALSRGRKLAKLRAVSKLTSVAALRSRTL